MGGTTEWLHIEKAQQTVELFKKYFNFLSFVYITRASCLSLWFLMVTSGWVQYFSMLFSAEPKR